MNGGRKEHRTKDQLREEIERLTLRLEESAHSIRVLREQRFRNTFENAAIGIAHVAMDGRILQCNRRFCEIAGYSPEAILGRTCAQITCPADWRTEQAQIQRLLDNEAAYDSIEKRFLRMDSSPVWVHLTRSIQRDEAGSPEHFIVLVEDISVRKQAEEALRRSEEKFRTLHAMSPIAIVLNRLDNGQFLESNQALWDMTGYSEEEFRSLTYWDITPIEYKDMEAKQLESLHTVGRYGPYEKEYIRKDGTRFPVLLSGVRIQDPGGTDLIYSVIQDITELKANEQAIRENREDLNRAQAVAHTGSWRLDIRHNVLLWSDETYRIFGVSQGTPMTYETFLAAVHPDDRQYVGQQWTAALRGAPYDIEHRIVVGDTVKWVRERAELEFDHEGVLRGGFGTVQDITERRRTEEALRDFTKTLESKVDQRTAELQYRARQLQKLALELSQAEDRERKHLAEILHDDLQQVLAAAKFHLGLLSGRMKNDPLQQGIIAEVDRMILEAIQKSRSLSHELSPVVLHQSNLAGALGWLAGQVQAKHGLSVRVDTFGAVRVETEAIKIFLYRAAQELLFNIVKHARVHEARIRVRSLGPYVCLSVSDRGRGFDPRALRETAGFGLLSIRERIELLGGRMKIRSARGTGSTFHIVVPDGQRAQDGGQKTVGAGPRACPTPGDHRGSPLRVLLADDHEIVREGLALLLAEAPDIEIVGNASNGREAVDQAYRLKPDVVIMDVAMPLINGDEATRQIKKHLPATRIIALSMYEEPDLVQRMYSAGAESYVLKTVASEELLAALRGGRPPAGAEPPANPPSRPPAPDTDYV